MGCATSQTEDKAEFLDVGDVLVQFDPTTGGAAPSTFQAIRVKVLRAKKLIKADSKAHARPFDHLSIALHASIRCLRPAHHTAYVHANAHVVRSSTRA